MKIKNAWNHLRTVQTHRKWVRHYCFKSRLYWRGLCHDLSKYSPIEFWESVKYYQDNRSPIDACKEQNGISKAWLHHRAKNRHHREWWTDNFDKGTATLPIPYKYAVEMLCDFLGAGRVYQGKSFTFSDELKWWETKLKEGIKIHPQTAYFIHLCLSELVFYANRPRVVFKRLKYVYKLSLWWNDSHNFPKVYYGNSLDFLDTILKSYD